MLPGIEEEEEEEKEEEEDFRQTEVCCLGAHTLCNTLSQQGLNPLKLSEHTIPCQLHGLLS